MARSALLGDPRQGSEDWGGSNRAKGITRGMGGGGEVVAVRYLACLLPVGGYYTVSETSEKKILGDEK